MHDKLYTVGGCEYRATSLLHSAREHSATEL
jgi:hypothetical protein